MPKRTSKSGSDLFIVDNSDTDWKVLRYLHDWCQLSQTIDIASGYFEIGALLGLKDEWRKVDHIRILMGDEVTKRTKAALTEGLGRRLDASLEVEKQRNDFLAGVPAIVEAIHAGRIVCRVYRKAKFHAKAYITHARLEVVGSSALVGSSNFTLPGLMENIELNVRITGRPVSVLQEWYEEHWNDAEDVTPELLRVIERHTREYSRFGAPGGGGRRRFPGRCPGLVCAAPSGQLFRPFRAKRTRPTFLPGAPPWESPRQGRPSIRELRGRSDRLNDRGHQIIPFSTRGPTS